MEDAAVTDIGSRLKQARERRNLSLAAIADSTKIPIHTLEAIERNDFARLPGGLFRRAFIRAYATEVDLDGDALASEYHEMVEIDRAALAMAASAAARKRVSRRRSWRSAAAGAGVLLGAWLASTIIGGLRQPDGPAPPPIENPIESVPTRTRGPATSGGGAETSAGAGTIRRPDALPLRLEIRADRHCWVSAFADGKRLLYRVLLPGESSLIEAREAIDLRLGDAGALTYVINGAPGRPLGGSGEVVSTRITTENERRFRADTPGRLLKKPAT